MKVANKEIEAYLYDNLGNSFDDGLNEWDYFTIPPKTETNKYVYSELQLLLEDGTKSDYIAEYLMALTIVDRAGANFADNTDADTCATYLGQLFDVRGRQVVLPSFNLISVRLTSVEDLTDREAQQTVIIQKLIFSILAEQT